MTKIKLTPARIKRLRPKPREFTLWDTATPHFGIRVMPTGAMRYIHHAPTNGKWRKVTIGDASRMALDEARTKAMDINAEGLKTPKPCPTLTEWIEDTYWPQASPHLKQSTRKTKRRVLDRILIPAFGAKRLDAINRTVIHEWFIPYSRTSPGAANIVVKTLGTILNHAVRAGAIPSNPVSRIRLNPRRKMTRFLSSEERERLFLLLDSLHPRNRIRVMAFKMLLFTGCRCNEILSLRWGEVGDTELNLAESKTGARKVWLGAEARAIIAEVRAMDLPSGPSDYVFPNYFQPGRCMTSHGFRNYWNYIRPRAGLEDVRIHDFRHSFASEAVRQGIPLHVISKLLGHSSMKMTMRYAHVSITDVEDASERIGNQLNGMLNGS